MKNACDSQIPFDNNCWPTGRVMAPCRSACPIGTDPAGYIMAIYMGEYDEAFRIIARENPLPGVCGRLCHHPCEEQCLRKHIDRPLAIRALKRFVVEKAGDTAFNTFIPMSGKTGRKVAVVGGGPAGLAAARDLAIAGHEVTVLEKSDYPGGILHMAVPGFVLPPAVLKNDIRRLEGVGIKFKTRHEIRSKKQIDGVFDQGFEAVLMAIGAMSGAVLPGFSVDNPRVESGLAFLMRTQRNKNYQISGRILVIGGGNVAVDVARVCVRQGAAAVGMYCLEDRESMPADDWEINRAEKEGIHLFPGWGIASVKEDTSGITVKFAKVKGINMEENGMLKPVLDTGDLSDVRADHVILAVGQRIDLSPMKGIRLNAGKGGIVHTDSNGMLSSYPGLFFAGDVLINPGNISEAIAGGKSAARAIDRFLMGEKQSISVFPETLPQRKASINKTVLSFLPEKKRQPMPEISPEKAVSSFKEVSLGFSETAARKEAQRCLNCAMCSNCIMDHQRVCQYTMKRLWG